MTAAARDLRPSRSIGTDPSSCSSRMAVAQTRRRCTSRYLSAHTTSRTGYNGWFCPRHRSTGSDRKRATPCPTTGKCQRSCTKELVGRTHFARDPASTALPAPIPPCGVEREGQEARRKAHEVGRDHGDAEEQQRKAGGPADGHEETATDTRPTIQQTRRLPLSPLQPACPGGHGASIELGLPSTSTHDQQRNGPQSEGEEKYSPRGGEVGTSYEARDGYRGNQKTTSRSTKARHGRPHGRRRRERHVSM